MSSSPTITQLIEASIQFERTGQMGDALEHARAALEQACAQNDTEGIAVALVRAGEIHYRLGHYADATANAEQALIHAGQTSRVRADAWIILGNCTFETGSLADAESFFLRAADLCRQIGYEHSRFRALHNLAACVYAMRGQFDLALTTYKEAYRLACELNSPMQAATLAAITFVYLQTNQPQPARATLNELAAVASSASVYQGYTEWLNAQLALNEGDLQTASTYFARARSFAEQLGDPAFNIFVRMGRATISVSWGTRQPRSNGQAMPSPGQVEQAIGACWDGH